MAHTYDKIRLNQLLGINVDVNEYDTFENLSWIILHNKTDVSEHINKGVWTNPNSIMLLRKCGFKFFKLDDKKIAYDMELDGVNIGLTLPSQVYFTNKIMMLLKKDKYFREKYCTDRVLINDGLIKTEKRIYNNKSDYGRQKRCDIGITSVENEKFVIGIEINEHHHKDIRTEDKKRQDDLLYRYNSDGLKLIKIFNLNLDNNNDVKQTELNEMCKDITDLIKNLDSIFDEQKFTVNYLVNHGLGDEKFCELLVTSHHKHKYIEFADIFEIVKGRIKDEYLETMEENFKGFHSNHINELEEYCKLNSKALQNKTNKLFDDSDDSDDDTYVEEEEDHIEYDIIPKLKRMTTYTNRVLKLNFNGIIRFLQYLQMHDEYFKFITDYNFVLEYALNANNCMMEAIRELNSTLFSFVHDRKIVDYGDS